MKRFLIPALVLGIAVAVYFVFFAGRGLGQFPYYFPKDMILDSYIVDLTINADEGDIKLLNEKHRANISYKSHRTITENIESFKSYFQANGYSFTEMPSLGDQRFISAQKDKASVGITFWEKSPVVISILYIIQK